MSGHGNHLPALDVEVGLRIQEGISQGNILLAFGLFRCRFLSLLCLVSTMCEGGLVKAWSNLLLPFFRPLALDFLQFPLQLGRLVLVIFAIIFAAVIFPVVLGLRVYLPGLL